MDAIIKMILMAIVTYDLRNGKIIRQYNIIKPATMMLMTPPH